MQSNNNLRAFYARAQQYQDRTELNKGEDVMIREAISDVVQRKNLTETEMEKVMDEIMSGQATPSQIGSFITGLRMKGETV